MGVVGGVGWTTEICIVFGPDVSCRRHTTPVCGVKHQEAARPLDVNTLAACACLRDRERAMVGGRREGQEYARTCESLAGMTIMGFCSLNAATLSTACLTNPTPKNFSHQLSFPLSNFISSSASPTTPSTISVNSLSPSDHSSPSIYKPPIKPFFLNGVSEITSGIFADGFSSGYSNSDQ